MSTIFGPSSAENTPVGMLNRLYNGDGTFCPAGTEVVADGATVFVNWYVLTQSGTITASQVLFPEAGQYACMRFAQSSATAQRYGFAQRILPEDCGDLRTAFFNVSARLRFSEDASLRWAVLASTAGTLDVVNQWDNASYAPGAFFISSVEVVNQGIFRNAEDAWGPLPQIPYQGPDDFTYLTLFVWTQDTVAQNGYLDAGLCQIAAGVVTQPYEHRPFYLASALEYPISAAWGQVVTQPTIGDGQKIIDGQQPFTDVASAATVDLGAVDSNKVRITGAAGPITSFGSAPAGVQAFVRFASTPTLTHNAVSLILPGATNIVAAANDWLLATSLGSGNWYVGAYQRAADGPLNGVLEVPTKAALSALAPGVVNAVLMRAYASAGDGGGGLFAWNGASAATANGGTIIAPDAGGVGRWIRVFDDPVFPDWFGPITGVDDSALLTAAFVVSRNVKLNSTKTYAFKDVDIPAHATFDMNRATVIPADSAKYIMRVHGYNAKVFGGYIDDANGRVVRQVTLAALASTSATSITVSSATGFEVGQRIAIALNTKYWFSTWVTSVAGVTIGLKDAMPSDANSGNLVWASWGCILIDRPFTVIDDLHFTNAWAGLLYDTAAPSSYLDEPGKGFCSRIKFDTLRFFGIARRRNANDHDFNGLEVTGGFSQVQDFTGTGAQTVFALDYPIHLKTDVTVTVNGVLQVIGVNYTLSGFNVTFAVAPANGAAISVTHFRDAVDTGFLCDARDTTTASGGCTADSVLVLDCHYGAQFIDEEVWTIGKMILDTCDSVALSLNAGDYRGSISQLFVGFAPTLLNVTDTSTGWSVLSLETNRTPAADAVSGVASTQILVDTGAVLTLDQTSWVGDFVGGGAITGGGIVNMTARDRFSFSTPATVAAGATVYLGPSGVATAEEGAQFYMTDPGFIYDFSAACALAPGGGQTFAVTIRVNGIPTALSDTISGAADTLATDDGFVPINQGDAVSVQLVASGGAAVTYFRGAVSVGFYPN